MHVLLLRPTLLTWCGLAAAIAGFVFVDTCDAAAQVTPGNVPAQSLLSEHPQYAKFRARFLRDFYYDGLVAEAISLDGTTITFADQPIHQGQALLVFATEEAVCRRFGLDPAPAIQLQRQILAAIEALDLQAEPALGYAQQSANGYFLRDTITGADDPRLQGRFPRVRSNFQAIKRGPDIYSPSDEQLFGLWFGLQAVVEFSSHGSLRRQAREIATRLYDYAANTGFVLRRPDGSKIDRGGDLRILSALAHDIQQAITGEQRWPQTWIADVVDLSDESLNAQAQNEAQQEIVAYWYRDQEWDGLKFLGTEELSLSPKLRLLLGLGPQEWLDPIPVQIVLLSLTKPQRAWPVDRYQAAAICSNHELAVLLSAHYTRRLAVYLSAEDLQRLLDKCPESGPSGANAAITGWNTRNRWVDSQSIYLAPETNHQFNGLDWLALHNLARLRVL